MAEFEGTGEIEPRNYFSEDLENWRDVVDQLTEHELAQSIIDGPPEEYILLSNTNLHPLERSYTEYRALQDEGFNIVIIRTATDTLGRTREDKVAIYVHAKEKKLNFNNKLFEEMRTSSLLRLLGEATTGGVQSWALNPNHDSTVVNQRIDQELIERGLMQRAFLTSMLMGEDKYKQEFRKKYEMDMLRSHDIEDRRVYNRLRQEGFTPLGPEEIYGMVRSSLREIFEQHPELRPLGFETEQ